MKTRLQPPLATVLAAGWAGFLLHLGSVPWLDVPGPQYEGNDKLAHLVAYGALGVASAFAARSWGLRPRAAVAVAVAAALATGTVDEVQQLSVAGRTGAVEDLAADVAGGLLGGVAIAALPRAPSARLGLESSGARRMAKAVAA